MGHRFLRFLPIAAALVASAFSHRAEACSFVPFQADPGVVAKGSYNLPALPRNVAFFWQQAPVGSPVPAEGVTVAEGEDGQAIVAFPVLDTSTDNGTYLVRPSEPLPENTTFSVYRYGSLAEQYSTSDYVDETPPEQPIIASGALTFHDGTQGCAEDSCGDYTSITFELEHLVSDDHARPDDIVYALYLGETKDEVITATTPYAYLREFHLFVDDSWVDRDAFIAISALDHAGNESARSDALRVNAQESEGCSVRTRSTRKVSGSLFLLAFGFALLRRVRRR
jgi:hypothetical protein